ncbi:MAG: recombinase family protein [Clostridia bacterium]|nr:recombinase family protein [Clostridia bacterium]
MHDRAQRAGLYLRLSKEDAGSTESLSISSQRTLLRQFARDKGFIFQEYTDDGYSGTNLERPALQRLFADIACGKIGIVITKDLSRLGRNSGRVSWLLDEYFPRMRIRYISVSEGIDTLCPTPSDGVLVPVMNLTNELYAGDISRKIRASLHAKMTQGAFIGSHPPFGYTRDKMDKNHLVPDPISAPFIRQIFTLAKEGYAPSQIAQKLNGDGIPTPSLYRRQEHPAQSWTGRMVSKLLANEVYLGHLLQGKTEKAGFKSSVIYYKPRSAWTFVENTHEPLVDTETWNTVRKKMHSRTRKREKGFVNLFSGIAKCADCGRNMSTVVSRKKGASASLVCGGYKAKGRSFCRNHTIDYQLLCQGVLTVLQRYQLSPAEEQTIAREIAARHKEETAQALTRLRERISSNRRKLERLYEDKYAGEITPELFCSLKEKFHTEQATLQQRLADTNQANPHPDLVGMEQWLHPRTLTPELLFGLVDRIEVHQSTCGGNTREQVIDIYLNFSCEEECIVVESCIQ